MRRDSMRVIYDADTDSLSLIFREGAVSESDEIREGVILDFDGQGRIVSLEVLQASQHIAEPQTIAYEVKGH